jgi:hypothetical protein
MASIVIGFYVFVCFGIGYFMGRANGKAETPVQPKLISTPAKAVVLKRTLQISRAEKMSVSHDDIIKEHIAYLRDALVEDAKQYVYFETDALEDYDADTITAKLVVYDIYKEFGERLSLVALAFGEVCDSAALKVDLHLVARFDLLACLAALDDRQTDIDGIAVEDTRKGRRDNAGDAACLDSDRRVLS